MARSKAKPRPRRRSVKAAASEAERTATSEEPEKPATVLDPPVTRGVKPKRKPPVRYSDELGTRICDALRNGQSLNSICKADGMPDESSVREWATTPDHPFAPNYTRAREIGYQKIADELLDIADDSRNDYVERLKDDGTTFTAFDYEHVKRSQLRVDTRKWLLSKCLPKVYGDKLEATHKVDEQQVFLNLWQAVSNGTAAKALS